MSDTDKTQDKKKKDKSSFSLKHAFKTAAVAAGMWMFMDPFFGYVWTHMGPGQHIAQIGSYVWSGFFDFMDPLVASITDPLKETFGIASAMAGTTENGARIVKDTAQAVTSDTGSQLLEGLGPSTLE